MAERKSRRGLEQAMSGRYITEHKDSSHLEEHAASYRPRVLVIGPGPAQIGGVTTFTQILLSSPIVAHRYELMHLDTTRAPRHQGLEGRFSLPNLRIFVRQTAQLVALALKRRPSLMHLPVTSRLSFWKAAAHVLVGRALGIKVVAHLHGGMFDQYYRQSSKSVQRLIGAALARADVVIALSPRWQRFLLDKVRPDLHVEVVHNTVDATFVHALKQNRDGPVRSSNEVLFVGGLGHRKGVFDILQAVPIVRAAHPDVAFVFAGGEAARGDRNKIDRLSEELGLDRAVRFLGPVTGLPKVQLFQRAALFILPSYGENMPYALLEAMAAGLPVVTTPVGAIPEIVQEGQHGFLIQPGDYTALARRIVQLLEDGCLRQRMGLANRKLIQNSYLPDVAMAQVVAIYDGLRGVDSSQTSPTTRGAKKHSGGSSQRRLPAVSYLQTEGGQKEQ